jgi:phosphate transport system substrate-binding protein
VIITPEGNTVKFKNVAVVGAVALSAAIALAGCSSTPSSTPTKAASAAPTDAAVAYKVDSSLTGTITAGGSSAQANAEAAWTAAYNAQAKGVTVNYDKSQGSGGGVTNWLAGSYDFAGSDSPLNPTQVASSATTCGADGAINLPVYLDGVAVIYNLPGVKDLQLSTATIAKIFSMKITTWDDAAIKADNPKATLPSTPITTVTRSDGSGTTSNFTNYLSQTDAADWTYPASNVWPVAGSSAQQGGSGVVNTVKAGSGTIGYADHSAIGDVTAAAIQSGTSKDFVTFSQKAATAAFTAAATDAPTAATGDLSLKLDYTKLTDKSAYPIPLVSYQIVCKTFKTAAQATLAKSYIGFVASTVGQKVASVNAGSAPIPDAMLAKIAKSLALVK